MFAPSRVIKQNCIPTRSSSGQGLELIPSAGAIARDVIMSKKLNVSTCLQLCVSTSAPSLQGSTNRRAPGFVNFVLALAYHFCLNLPAAFTQPGARLLVEPCSES